MKVFMTGGAGFLGSYLVGKLLEAGHEVTVLTRSARGQGGTSSGVTFVQGNPTQTGPWQERVAGHDLIINLAGASIFTPWTAKARMSIRESRVSTTRNLVDSFRNAPSGTVLLSASAVGYYGGREDDAVLTEDNAPGSDFLARLSVDWEHEAGRARDFGVRVAICRFGIVMGRGGGALGRMIPAFRSYMGSSLGSGRQWFSWIHQEDLWRAMQFLWERGDLSGPFNFTAPEPVRNADLTRLLGEALGKPTFMPAVPGFVLKMILGDFAEVLLKGQRVVPKRLQEAGFTHRFPTLKEALADVVC